MSLTSLVVQSLSSDLWTLDADLNLLELWSSSVFTFEVLLEDFLTSYECAVSFISPLINNFLSSITNLASWKVMFCQRIWDVYLLKLEELTALFSVWVSGVDINLLIVVNPLASLESLPFIVLVSVYVTFMMPVSLIPRPLMFKSLFGWTPVVIFTIIILVPDTLIWVPLPGLSSCWLGILMAPVANSWVIFMVVYKLHTFSLGLQNVFVLSINFGFSLSKVSFSFFFNVSIEVSGTKVLRHLQKRDIVLVLSAHLLHLGTLDGLK
jgi:hypothetical protein